MLHDPSDHLLSCLCTSAGMLHDPSPACLSFPSVGMLHDQSPALPLLCVCRPAACSISCPVFTVRLSACCLIYLLLCHFYLSVGLMHATSPAFPVHLLACCMINLLLCIYCPFVCLLPDLYLVLPACCMIYFLPCSVSKRMHKSSDIEP
jgi:hypothetical protein